MGGRKHDTNDVTQDLLIEKTPGASELESVPRHHHMFTVYLMNDDYTPMDFVVEVLMKFFSMGLELATEVMLQVHFRGRAICGLYTRDVAETKVMQVNEFARRNQHPLLCGMEEN